MLVGPEKPTLLQEQRADICGKKSGKVVGSKKTIRYEAIVRERTVGRFFESPVQCVTSLVAFYLALSDKALSTVLPVVPYRPAVQRKP